MSHPSDIIVAPLRQMALRSGCSSLCSRLTVSWRREPNSFFLFGVLYEGGAVLSVVTSCLNLGWSTTEAGMLQAKKSSAMAASQSALFAELKLIFGCLESFSDTATRPPLGVVGVLATLEMLAALTARTADLWAFFFSLAASFFLTSSTLARKASLVPMHRAYRLRPRRWSAILAAPPVRTALQPTHCQRGW